MLFIKNKNTYHAVQADTKRLDAWSDPADKILNVTAKNNIKCN